MDWEVIGQLVAIGTFIVSILRLNESINTLNRANEDFRRSIEESVKDRRMLNVAIEKVAESVKSAHRRIDRIEEHCERVNLK